MSLPSGWAQTTLGEVAETKLGKMLDAAKNRGVERAYLRNVNVRWDEFDLSDLQTMRFTDEEFEALRVRDGDIFACEGGEPGRCAVWRSGPREIAYQKALHRIRPREGVDPDYLAKRIEVAVRGGEVAHLLTGTTIKHLPQVGLQRIGFALPPLAEQRRIVAKLDALTARLARAREEVSKTIDLQRRLKAAICEAAISVDADELPLGNALADIRYGTAQKCGYDGSIPVLRIPNVARGEIDLSDLKSADFESKDIAALSLAAGDILIVRSNGSLDLVGRSAVVNENAAGMLYAGYLIRLRLDPTKALPAYVQLWLSAPSTRAVIEGLARSSSGVNNINSKQLEALRIRLPDLETQKKKAETAKAAFARADRLEAEANKALALIDRLETAILAKAFRGELVPQDPNDEPASVLLERIRARRAAEPKAKRGRRPILAS